MTAEELRELLSSRENLEACSRDAAKAVYCGEGISLCRVLGEIPLYVDAGDVGIASHLMLDGFWESWVTVALARLVGFGDVVVDVGACYGYYTALFAVLVGPGGRIFSVEPNERSYDLLKKTVEVNGIRDYVRVFGEAAGKEDGGLYLEYPSTMPGSGSLVKTPDRSYIIRQYAIVSPLDDLITHPISLLKIDAEGMDFDVVRGAEGILSQSPNAKIALEFLPSFYQNPEAELDYMAALGFRGFSIDYAGGLVSLNKPRILSDPNCSWNLVFVR